MKTLGAILLVTAVLLTLVVGSRVLNRVEQFGMSPGTLTQLQSTSTEGRTTPYLLF